MLLAAAQDDGHTFQCTFLYPLSFLSVLSFLKPDVLHHLITQSTRILNLGLKGFYQPDASLSPQAFHSSSSHLVCLGCCCLRFSALQEASYFLQVSPRSAQYRSSRPANRKHPWEARKMTLFLSEPHPWRWNRTQAFLVSFEEFMNISEVSQWKMGRLQNMVDGNLTALNVSGRQGLDSTSPDFAPFSLP